MISNNAPYQAPITGSGGLLTTVWHGWFSRLQTFLSNVVDYTVDSLQVPVTGFSIQVADKAQLLTLDPAGTLATGTILLPVTPYNGQSLTVLSTNEVTALTVTPSGSDAIKNAPTTLLAGGSFSYYYRSTNATWYRLN